MVARAGHRRRSRDRDRRRASLPQHKVRVPELGENVNGTLPPPPHDSRHVVFVTGQMGRLVAE
jgi:hypothetical protein